MIPDGALLIRNGVIEEVGTSRRIENLAIARTAKEIDAGGRIVLPAFVDADAVLVYPQPSGRQHLDEEPSETRIGLLSKHRLGYAANAAAAEWVRAGAVSLGAHTAYADSLRDTIRILRIHQTLQGKPLRIRSIFSPRATPGDAQSADLLFTSLMGKWLSALRSRKLVSITEFIVASPGEPNGGLPVEKIRLAAIFAAETGFAIRLRANGENDSAGLALACAGGSVAFLAPPWEPDAALRVMGTMGCVHVIPVTAALRTRRWGAGAVRNEIDSGIPIALGSGYQPGGLTSMNPQYLLHLGVEQFGMTPAEAICATTYNGACSLRMSHVTGSLEPGKSADLTMLDVPDYRDLVYRTGHNDVCLTMRNGQTVYARSGLKHD